MSTPTMKGMEAVLREFKKSTCDGVSGVMRIDGPKPGPVLGITACTHGNEPSGLAIFHHLLNDLRIKEALKCGTLYLVVNNITQLGILCGHNRRWYRSRKMNMNRLPKDVMSSTEQSMN